MIISGLLLTDPAITPTLGWIRVREGRIAELGEGPPPELPAAGNDRAVICPGFIDAHVHPPQIDSIGYDGLELLDWLERIIYPAELHWGEPRRASIQIDSAHRRMLEAGTLGYAGFLTSHPHAVACVVDSLRRTGMRAIVGQVLMDRAAPVSMINQPVEPPRPVRDDRITVSVNPRFAVSCSGELLRHAGELAGNLFPVQTHLAESAREVELVNQLFPEHGDYTSVYDHFGLLGPRTLLAHAVHLAEREWRLIAERGSAVVHCPAANTFLASGVFDLGAARRFGLRLGLGSDVAAGPDLAMPRVARAMIEVAKLRRMSIDPRAHVPSPAEAWQMMTRGNAEVLGWDDVGQIEVGAAADLLVLEPPFEIDRHLISRFLYTWRNDFIAARIVGGRLVDGGVSAVAGRIAPQESS